jgi:hypothetical protein
MTLTHQMSHRKLSSGPRPAMSATKNSSAHTLRTQRERSVQDMLGELGEVCIDYSQRMHGVCALKLCVAHFKVLRTRRGVTEVSLAPSPPLRSSPPLLCSQGDFLFRGGEGRSDEGITMEELQRGMRHVGIDLHAMQVRAVF